jgi:hypothetical protein
VRQVCIRFRELSYTDSVWLLAANRTLASNQLDAATRRRSQVQIQGPCHQCCGSGSGIGCLFEPWIRDGRKSASGSGIRDGRKSASGSGIRDEQPGSYFLELRNHFFPFYLNSLMRIRIRDPGWRQFGSRIRDLGWKKVGSGINIPDPPHCYQLKDHSQHCAATN